MIIFLSYFDIITIIEITFAVIIMVVLLVLAVAFLYHGVSQSCRTCVCYTFQVSDVPVIADAGETGGITPIYRRCNYWIETECRHCKVLGNIHNHVIELSLLHFYILSFFLFSATILHSLSISFFVSEDWVGGLGGLGIWFVIFLFLFPWTQASQVWQISQISDAP